jgi:DNA-binding transcriptional LysR family regulator
LMGRGDGFDGNLIARPIASSDGILCASPAYLAAHGAPAEPEELTTHRVLRFKSPANRHRIVHLINPNDGGREVDVPIEPALLVNHTDTLIRACVGGAGISVQSIDLIADLLHGGELIRVLPSWITGRNTLYAALPSRKFIPARTSVFLEFLTDYTRRVVKKMESQPGKPDTTT